MSSGWFNASEPFRTTVVQVGLLTSHSWETLKVRDSVYPLDCGHSAACASHNHM